MTSSPIRLDARYDLRSLFMQAPMAIAIVSGPEFIIELANGRMLEFWDRTEKEALGQTFVEVFPEVRDQEIPLLLQRVYHTGEGYVAPEYPMILCRNGEMQSVYVSFTLEALRDQTGEIQSIMIVANEVTELVKARQQAEENNALLERKVEERTLELKNKSEELRKQKEFLETILDASVDLIGVYDLEERIIAFNRTCEKNFGFTKGEVYGRTFADVFPSAINKQAHRDLQRGLLGELVHNEAYYSEISGRYLEDFVIPLRDDFDRVYGALVIAHDITEIVEANQKLQHTNTALERSNHELEQFAYIASHDLQEPLRKISMFSELLRRAVPDLNAEGNQYIEKILRSSKRMTDLIKDVLTYSKLSKPGEAFVQTDLNLIIDNIQTDFELLIQQKQALVFCDRLPTIEAIPLQVHQLFSNLLGNSLKFSTREPVIRIAAKEMSADEIQGDPKLNTDLSYIEILVSDNGIGFEQQYAEQIFTIFQRLNSRADYSGTGIGLALCKKIVDNHQGSISAVSALDHGATFKIRLPLNQVPSYAD